jgi:hypothetical protein
MKISIIFIFHTSRRDLSRAWVSVIHDLHTAQLEILFRYMFQKTYTEIHTSIFRLRLHYSIFEKGMGILMSTSDWLPKTQKRARFSFLHRRTPHWSQNGDACAFSHCFGIGLLEMCWRHKASVGCSLCQS